MESLWDLCSYECEYWINKLVFQNPAAISVSSLHLQTGLWFIPPEPEGRGLECGVGQQRRKNTRNPQRQEPNQLPNALSSQVCISVFDPGLELVTVI